MRRVQFHPDGHVIIEVGPAFYFESKEAFISDCAALGLAAPQEMPANELYLPGVLHCAFTDATQHAPALAEQKELLDSYIGAADKFVELKKARIDAAIEAARAAAQIRNSTKGDT